ncbi:cytidylyltransferase family protein [Nitzschia inconspicua]|uniref:Cytidylyltransferase family protein n=1 Tax=Nitzschia inconspicua TaxID=303405 RepID=A0A9K3LSB9_9STRA|nr:cytidylyltransferase family protein [Nitzschia inconspicua]
MSFLEEIPGPFRQNLMASTAMVLYYKMALELSCWIRLRWKRSIVSRNVLQLFFSSTVIFWPYFDTSDWSWKFAVLLPLVVLSRLVYKGAFLRDPTDLEVQNWSLSSSPSELLLGPVFLAAVFLWLTLYQFMTEEAAIVAAVSFGDALAPLIGSRWGRHLYSVPFSKFKTMEGSVVGVFLGTIAASYFYMFMMGMTLLPLRIILAYAGIAAVAEGTAPGNCDNFVICVVLHFSIPRIQQLLPP